MNKYFCLPIILLFVYFFCLGGGQNLTLIEEAFHENWGRRPNLINLTCKGAKCGPGSKGKKAVCLPFISCLFTFLSFIQLFFYVF